MKYLRYKVKHHFTREQIRMMYDAVVAMDLETNLDQWKVLRSQLFDVIVKHDKEIFK